MPHSPDKDSTTPKPKRKKRAKPGAGAKPTSRQDLEDILDPASIIGEATLTSPKGNTYRVITTDEMDPYDKPERAPKKKRK